ncbi:MAG: hypothetical protein J6M15_07650 [Prevotella sp.]|nr:hypothetical protein [Prevotella sp.]
MKTMNLLVMFMALSLSTSVMAQSSVQAKLKENRAALKKENVSKDAKKEAKRLKKEGWTVSPGGLPLEKQVDRLYMYLEQYDDELNPLYFDGEGRATAENFAAAQIQATELARMNLASKISSEATGIIDNLVANKMLADDQAASITTTMVENKTIFSQKLGRLQTPLTVVRELKNKNKEVMVRVVSKTSSIQEIAKEAIRAELEKQGKELSEELKAYLGKD